MIYLVSFQGKNLTQTCILGIEDLDAGSLDEKNAMKSKPAVMENTKTEMCLYENNI